MELAKTTIGIFSKDLNSTHLREEGNNKEQYAIIYIWKIIENIES